MEIWGLWLDTKKVNTNLVVAQLVERRTVVPQATGSNPVDEILPPFIYAPTHTRQSLF